jgi:hypothetical protein
MVDTSEEQSLSLGGEEGIGEMWTDVVEGTVLNWATLLIK